MPIDWGSVIGTGVQGILSPINTFINNKMARETAKIDREENYKYNEMAADNADKRARAQYADMYSPQAQLKQIKEAGLSPSLMYGGTGGAGGATAPQGAGVSGVKTDVYPYASPEMGLMAAQIANINADTKEKEANISNINADTEFTFTNILKAAAETDNVKLENSILKLEKEKREIDLIVQKEVSDEVIKQAQQKTLIMFEQCEKLRNENKSIELQNQFTEETFSIRVKQLAAEYKNTLSQSALNWANVNLSEAQIDSLAEHVAIAHFNSRTERLETNAQIQQFQRLVQQWAKENGFTEQQLKQDKTKNWLEFAAKIFGSICFVGGSVGGAVIKAGQ